MLLKNIELLLSKDATGQKTKAQALVTGTITDAELMKLNNNIEFSRYGVPPTCNSRSIPKEAV